MLPTPASSSSALGHPLLDDSLSPPRGLALDKLPLPARRALSHPWVLRARTYKQQHPLRALLLGSLVALSLAWLLVSALVSFLESRSDPSTYAHGALAWGTHPDAVTNWGDYVGLGLQRAKVLSGTPQGYADIGDRWARLDKELGGPFYRRRRSVEEKARGDEPQDLSEGTAGKGKKAATVLNDRHGVLGGASVEWSTGVVGSGAWLGPGVDMRKDGSYALPVPTDDDADEGQGEGSAAPSSSSAAMLTRGHAAFVDRIVDRGWSSSTRTTGPTRPSCTPTRTGRASSTRCRSGSACGMTRGGCATRPRGGRACMLRRTRRGRRARSRCSLSGW